MTSRTTRRANPPVDAFGACWHRRFLPTAIALICALVSTDGWCPDPQWQPGADDWMLPPCSRQITTTYPVRPPECDGGNSGTARAPAPAAPARGGSAVSATGASDVAPSTPIRVSAPPDQVKVVRFARFRTSIREGENLGEVKIGIFCNASVPLTLSARTETIVLSPVVRPLRDEFTQNGYHDPSRGHGLFEEDADQARVDLQLGGMLEGMSVSYCSTAAGARIEGNARFRVRWELFDPVARKVVFGKTTEGSYRTQGTENVRESEFFGRAYRDAIRLLLADQQFHDLVAGAATTPTLADAVAATPATESITLRKAALLPSSLADNMTTVRSAVVTILRAGASGSGFFIGEDGYVLTNSHVVASQRFVRVRLATGRELVGEVLKQDVGRDVALIKTEGRGFVALPLHTAEVNVGSEVTAIGSPLGESLSGTVTRGIVSGYRN